MTYHKKKSKAKECIDNVYTTDDESPQVDASTSKNLGGRPPYERNEKDEIIVRALCATGAPQTLIGWYLKKDPKTLRKYYPDVFKVELENRCDMVEYSLFYQAVFLNITAASIYYLKCHKSDVYNDKKEQEFDAEAQTAFLKQLADMMPS